MAKDKKNKELHRTSIGGQAVIEGVMMRGPREIAVAVRKPDGEIIVDKKPLHSKLKWVTKIPIVRGCVNFFSSLVVGVRALMFSASFFELDDEEEKQKIEQMSEQEREQHDKKNARLLDATMYFSLALSLVAGVGLFMLLPNVIVGFVKSHIPSDLLATLIEGVVRIAIFLGYVALTSLMKDIRRVFEYHGAEHKTIFCYEYGEELTVENVKKQSRLHPRCGTSFLLIVMVISIILFSFISWENIWMRLGLRLLLLPVVAGLSYEIIKWAGRSDCWLSRAISQPGMWLQKLTTREPDASQIEVAIASLTSVLTGNREEDKW